MKPINAMTAAELTDYVRAVHGDQYTAIQDAHGRRLCRQVGQRRQFVVGPEWSDVLTEAGRRWWRVPERAAIINQMGAQRLTGSVRRLFGDEFAVHVFNDGCLVSRNLREYVRGATPSEALRAARDRWGWRTVLLARAS